MIRVDRGAEPDGFAIRSANWQKRFEEALKEKSKPTPNKFWSRVRREIRPDAEALRVAFHGKCAFCESKMAHVSSPQIEHYRPKSKYPDEMFAWQNWLLSCGRCNQKKWAHFPDCDGQPCLLDPAAEEPSEHLEFLAAQILDKTERGQQTIKLIGLDRSPLEEERAQWLMNINALLLLACCVPTVAAQARELLIWAMQANAPYAAMTRCYLNDKTPGLANPQMPHPFIKSSNQLERMASLLEQHSDSLMDLV